MYVVYVSTSGLRVRSSLYRRRLATIGNAGMDSLYSTSFFGAPLGPACTYTNAGFTFQYSVPGTQGARVVLDIPAGPLEGRRGGIKDFGVFIGSGVPLGVWVGFFLYPRHGVLFFHGSIQALHKTLFFLSGRKTDPQIYRARQRERKGL